MKQVLVSFSGGDRNMNAEMRGKIAERAGVKKAPWW